ncbi:hypothetical protein PGTUg99_019864 [Puccinia graminis f. sp. tritici]|nr:hypothetical protein PGTUg99_019864 [Puccinia graminis f. sp. tritici]
MQLRYLYNVSLPPTRRAGVVVDDQPQRFPKVNKPTAIAISSHLLFRKGCVCISFSIGSNYNHSWAFAFENSSPWFRCRVEEGDGHEGHDEGKKT